jgi:hypothetical protein
MLTRHEITDTATALNRKNENTTQHTTARIRRLALERWENEGGFTVEVDIVTSRLERFAVERWENEGGCLDCRPRKNSSMIVSIDRITSRNAGEES